MERESLAARVAAAQGRMPNPKLDSTNPRFGSRYASLGAVEAAVRPSLVEAGLGYRQTLTADGWLVLMAYDELDEMELARFPVEMGGSAQARGSELTYGRRYNLLAAFGLVGDEDDDGNAASEPRRAAQRRERDYSRLTALKQRYAAAKGVSEAQAGKDIVEEFGNPNSMDDDGYSRYLVALEASVAGMERGDG